MALPEPERDEDGRTPGQVGYEAYADHTAWRSLDTNAHLPQWNGVPMNIKEAWEVAASAVVSHENRDDDDAPDQAPETLERGDESGDDAPPAEGTDDYADLDGATLKDLARRRQLPVSGNRSELIDRLRESDRQDREGALAR